MNTLGASIRRGAALLAAVLLCAAALACGGPSEDPYVFRAGDAAVAVNARADEVLPALGTPLSVDESVSCGGIAGVDRVYAFRGFRVFTTPGPGGDVVNMVELTDDSLATPEGLRVGMPSAEIERRMGGEGERVGQGTVYEAGGVRLQFLVRDGSITNIQYIRP